MSLIGFPLLRLPNELILIISQYLNANDLNSLLRANRRLAALLALHLVSHQDNLLTRIAKEDGKTGLCSAVERKNEALVRLVLEKLVAVDVNETIDIRGRTTLHWAAGNGHVKLVELLLERGADIAAQTINGSTPLHKAVSDERILQMLLKRGADITARSAEGSTPLNTAVDVGHEQIVKLLLESGSDVETITVLGETPLHRAAYRGRESISMLLLEYGANIHARDRRGATPLHQAARGHGPRESLVMKLLERGADVSAKTQENVTPLHYAVESRNEAVVRLLIEAGSDISTIDYGGSTPLHWAVCQGDCRIIELLLEFHADINARTARKAGGTGYRTALHLAAMKKNPLCDEELASFLLEKGADITAVDQLGMSALHYASQSGNKRVASILLEKGADVTARASDWRTSLHVAAAGGHTGVVRLLLDYGADIDALELRKTRTPLALAVRGGHEATVRLLLENGACASICDIHGDTVLDDAQRFGYEDIFRVLLEHRDVS